MKRFRQFSTRGLALGVAVLVVVIALVAKTSHDLQDPTGQFNKALNYIAKIQVVDRYGEPINVTYRNPWNIHYLINLSRVPVYLQQAIIFAEDKRFFSNRGADWLARASALLTNIVQLRVVRGASTISEQVVRMLHPRPRTVWSRWLEGFEATMLEESFTKHEILEFYLNQVPYAANRRGVVQAARYYFDRDLATLNHKEMLALSVLIRAPSRLDLWHDPNKIIKPMTKLAKRLIAAGLLANDNNPLEQKFALETPSLKVFAPHFYRYVLSQKELSRQGKVKTTLDGSLQNQLQKMANFHLAKFTSRRVNNAAALVVDHQTSEILAWVVAGNSTTTPGYFIDAVTTPRQPGSAMKPLIYARALDKGWSDATVINDSPLTEALNSGLHDYKNYSRKFYGSVTVRNALGNSLNIPAVKTLQYIGVDDYLEILKRMNFTSLAHNAAFYGDGLALGNGEISLYELVQGYSTLANNGISAPLNIFANHQNRRVTHRVFSSAAASLIGDILSDPQARSLEFGIDSVLNLPVQTAVKTGTSSDYRDSWAVGFNYRYTVGVWMGNLDRLPTDGITGSSGPAFLLRAIFAELTRNQATMPLYFSPKLKRYRLCADSMTLKPPNDTCAWLGAWFLPGRSPPLKAAKATKAAIKLSPPVDALKLAYDPRLPANVQAMEFRLQGTVDSDKIEWIIDGEKSSFTQNPYQWPIVKGKHSIEARVLHENNNINKIAQQNFVVK